MLNYIHNNPIEAGIVCNAEDYTFKPHDSVRSFGEQMAHIGMSSKLMSTMFITGEKVDFDPAEGAKMEKMAGASKEEVQGLHRIRINIKWSHLSSSSRSIFKI